MTTDYQKKQSTVTEDDLEQDQGSHGKGFATMLAAQADLHSRLKKVEGK